VPRSKSSSREARQFDVVSSYLMMPLLYTERHCKRLASRDTIQQDVRHHNSTRTLPLTGAAWSRFRIDWIGARGCGTLRRTGCRGVHRRAVPSIDVESHSCSNYLIHVAAFLLALDAR
jgi:hypothetical protein